MKLLSIRSLSLCGCAKEGAASCSVSLAVRGQETGLRHLVVWLFADHRGSDPAVRWPHVWTVRTQDPGTRELLPIANFSLSHLGFTLQLWGCVWSADRPAGGLRLQRGFLPVAGRRRPSRHAVCP